jgi:hypothetical protein
MKDVRWHALSFRYEEKEAYLEQHHVRDWSSRKRKEEMSESGKREFDVINIFDSSAT